MAIPVADHAAHIPALAPERTGGAAVADRATRGTPRVSVLVPAWNEAGNVPELVARVATRF